MKERREPVFGDLSRVLIEAERTPDADLLDDNFDEAEGLPWDDAAPEPAFAGQGMAYDGDEPSLYSQTDHEREDRSETEAEPLPAGDAPLLAVEPLIEDEYEDQGEYEDHEQHERAASDEVKPVVLNPAHGEPSLFDDADFAEADVDDAHFDEADVDDVDDGRQAPVAAELESAGAAAALGAGQATATHRVKPKAARTLIWYDRQLLVAALSLLAVGLVMVTSSSLAIAEKQTGNSFYYALRHGFYLAVALTGALVVMQIPTQWWARYSSYLLIGGIALLALILVPGIGHEVNGSVRWIALGGMTLQVSELVKLFLVVFMASYLVRKSDEMRTQIKGFLKPLALLGLLGMLLLAEPDFGATVVVFTTAFAMMFLAGAQLWQYIAIGGAGLGGLWFIAIASPYRMKRLTTFLDPWSDPYGSGYQLTQSLIAFGRGGLQGQGLGNSVQKLAYLPEAHTDFVFAVLAEELGLIGVTAVLALFAWLAWRIFTVGRLALAAGQPFSAYMSFGIAVWLSLQAVINIGVASGLLPTKGLTLPLVSYGGTSVIVTCAAVALVLRIDFERRQREFFGLGPRQQVLP